MPASTEQVLHPDHYARGDAPLRVVLDSTGPAVHEDVLGEMETQVLVAQLGGRTRPDELAALGWGGDRYRVVETPDGPALVWYIVFDDAAAAARFGRQAARLATASRAGYRALFEPIRVGGSAGMRYVLAPTGWTGWTALPAAALAGPGG
jgi:hypothetical protein